MRAKKLTVAIDFDEVLFPLSVELIRRHNGQYGTSFTTNHFVTYVLGDVWGHTYVESVAKVHAFLGEDHINVPPIAGAVDALAQLRQDYELIVVTSRDRLLQQQTERWLSSHFPRAFSDVFFAGNKHTGRGFQTKVELCLRSNAVCLIDDSLDYASECSVAGIPGILFGDYPWNESASLPPGVLRAECWADVGELVRSLAAAAELEASTHCGNRKSPH